MPSKARRNQNELKFIWPQTDIAGMASMPAISSAEIIRDPEWDLDRLVEVLPSPAARLCSNGLIRTWNCAATRLLGYQQKDILGAPIGKLLECVGPLDWLSRCARTRLTGVQHLEAKGIRADGSFMNLAVTLLPVSNSSVNALGVLCLLANTKPLGREADLQGWKGRVEAALSLSGTLVREWQPAADQISCVGDTRGLLGIDRGTVVGGIEGWAELIHTDDREIFLRKFEHTLAERDSFEMEYLLRHTSGRYTPVRDRAHLAIDADGRIVHVTAVIVDVSEQRAIEDRLRHSQKMAAFGRLAGGVAHDFNNLLTVISGYAEMMREGFSVGEPKRRLIIEIEKAAGRAASLTGQLLAFSRQQVLKLRILDLNVVLTDVARMLQRLIGEDIRLSVEAGKELGAIRADVGQIEQVLMNLAVNARDAMPDGGMLQICTCNVTVADRADEDRHEVPAGEYVTLTVSDTGIGMDEDVRSHIFEPFFTTKAPGEGTGLGLATCHSIVTECGGHIKVQSTLNEGTVFRIYLPRANAAEGAEGGPKVTAPSQGGSETILLVEDDATVRKLSAAVLVRLGYRVAEAENGEEALGLIDKGELSRIDLMITDMVMPKMGGLALAEQMNVRFPRTRILFTSGYPNQAAVPEGAYCKVAFMQKPFVPKTLANHVRALLDA